MGVRFPPRGLRIVEYPEIGVGDIRIGLAGRYEFGGWAGKQEMRRQRILLFSNPKHKGMSDGASGGSNYMSLIVCGVILYEKLPCSQ